METENTISKDIILREHLAIERTRLANERTLLSYIRTALYFIVAGSTLGQVVDTIFWRLAGSPLLIIGLVILLLGIFRFYKVKRSIRLAQENIGLASNAFISAARTR